MRRFSLFLPPAFFIIFITVEPVFATPSTFSKILSHITAGGGICGTWDATNGAALFVKKDTQVVYTGTNPSREFDTTEGWASNYTSYFGFAGARISFFSAGIEYESFKAQPKEDRFTMENTQFGIAISLPTVDLKGTVLSARAELNVSPNGPISPYFAVSYPISHSLKSLSYNSDPEPVEVKNDAWTIYGVKVSPYDSKDLNAKFFPALEVGFGIRLKGRVRLKAYARYRRLDWDLFYHKHQDEIIQIGASLAI